MSGAPSLTIKAIAVLGGAVAFAASADAPSAAPRESAQTATFTPSHNAAPGPQFTDPGDTFDPLDVALGEHRGSSRARTDAGDRPALTNSYLPDDQLLDGLPELPVVEEEEAAVAEPMPKSSRPNEAPEAGCLARTICAVKEKIRWQTAAWTPALCHKIANSVLSASKQHAVSPSLLLAVMINESDLDEKAARITMRENKIYAKDSGLMGIRCVLDRRNRCLNGNVRGLNWTDVMNPATNIALGARELAYWRRGGAVTKTVVNLRDATGRIRPVFKKVPCRHKDHAYWAHYNHGPYYIAKGHPRHYPHRVAVLDHALASVLNVDAPELRNTRITIHDRGKRPRTADRPLEARYRKLCSQIHSVGACSAVALNE